MRTILVVAVSALVAGCGPTPTEVDALDPISAGETGARAADAIDATVELGAGAEVQISGTRLVLRLLAVTEDSRCPVDVSCIWEGNARLSLETVLDGVVGSHALDSAEAAWPDGSPVVRVGRYEVTFLSLLPTPSSTTPIDPADYVAALRVTGDVD